MFWKLTLAIVVFAGIGGAVQLSGVSRAHLKEALHYLEERAMPGSEAHDVRPVAVQLKEQTPWNGLVALKADEIDAIGVQTVKVQAQDTALKLELTGRTAYDLDTLTKIRPRFDTLVERVYASLGQHVKKGEALVDLHSTDLAAAKSDFQSKYVQLQHDEKLYNVRQELVKTGAISRQVWVDTQNDEKKSRLEYTLARDKLKVLKVPDNEIEPLLAPLRDATPNSKAFGSLDDKAKMTLVSPVDGIVIEREVVPQNFYETTSVLMVIAPLDHLWVLVNVFELDQDKVRLGQTMEIQFPFLQDKIKGTVQYVASEVSKDTHAVKVRASVPNPNGRLKSDMLVKAILNIPPTPGQTVIPRQAMVTSNGHAYVFVLQGHHGAASVPPGAGRGSREFERRKIVVGQENHDNVIVNSGLQPGEEIATTGSLILAQLYEDANTAGSGLPTE